MNSSFLDIVTRLQIAKHDLSIHAIEMPILDNHVSPVHSNVTPNPNSTIGGDYHIYEAILLMLVPVSYCLLVLFLWTSKRFQVRKREFLSSIGSHECQVRRPESRYSDDEDLLLGESSEQHTQRKRRTEKILSLWFLCKASKALFLGLFFPPFVLALVLLWKKRELHGFWNLGNTCYFNAVMQALVHTQVLQEQIQKSKKDGVLANALGRLYETSRKRSICRPLNFSYSTSVQNSVRQIHNLLSQRVPRFSGYRQNDSHECLRHLLEELRKEERNYLRESLSTEIDVRKFLTEVDKVFGGHFVTVYTCQRCSIPYHLFEPFLDISLPIFFRDCLENPTASIVEVPRRWDAEMRQYAAAIANLMTPLSQYQRSTTSGHGFNHSKPSIEECLWYFTRSENIHNEYLCNPCNNAHLENGGEDVLLTSATKQTLIFDPPAILTIHLKRFEMKPGKSVKRSDMVTYGELLDIAPYCSSQCLRNYPPSQNIWYSLYAVVVHTGTLEFGHYFAYVKLREDEPDIKEFLQKEYFDRNLTVDQLIEMMRKMNIESKINWKPSEPVGRYTWYLMNDSSVNEVSTETVLNQEAYLLFYERIDYKENRIHSV